MKIYQQFCLLWIQQSRLGSNQRIWESKSHALPLGYATITETDGFELIIRTQTRYCQQRYSDSMQIPFLHHVSMLERRPCLKAEASRS